MDALASALDVIAKLIGLIAALGFLANVIWVSVRMVWKPKPNGKDRSSIEFAEETPPVGSDVRRLLFSICGAVISGFITWSFTCCSGGVGPQLNKGQGTWPPSAVTISQPELKRQEREARQQAKVSSPAGLSPLPRQEPETELKLQRKDAEQTRPLPVAMSPLPLLAVSVPLSHFVVSKRLEEQTDRKRKIEVATRHAKLEIARLFTGHWVKQGSAPKARHTLVFREGGMLVYSSDSEGKRALNFEPVVAREGVIYSSLKFGEMKLLINRDNPQYIDIRFTGENDIVITPQGLESGVVDVKGNWHRISENLVGKWKAKGTIDGRPYTEYMHFKADGTVSGLMWIQGKREDYSASYTYKDGAIMLDYRNGKTVELGVTWVNDNCWRSTVKNHWQKSYINHSDLNVREP